MCRDAGRLNMTSSRRLGVSIETWKIWSRVVPDRRRRGGEEEEAGNQWGREKLVCLALGYTD